jgi:hypothetical protein
MAVLQIKSFGGISPKIPPRYLQDSQAQVAINCPVFSGALQPLQDVGSAVATLSKTGVPQTIYRFGQEVISDSQYWFHWTTDVNVCRGQISGDTSEWTFYTGDGIPKATYATIALSGANYPAVSRPLGLPAPELALTAAPAAFVPTAYAAEVVLTATHISLLTTTYGVLVSTTGQAAGDYTTVTLSGAITASSVATAINALAGVNATASSGTVIVKTDATGEATKLYVKFRTGSIPDTSGTFTYSGIDYSASGVADSYPYLVIDDTEIGSIAAGNVIVLNVNGTDRVNASTSTTLTATTLATFLNSRMSGQLVATAYGGCVVVTPGSEGATDSATLFYRRYVGGSEAKVVESVGSEAAAPARLFITQADIDSVESRYLSVLVNGTEFFAPIINPSTVNSLATFRAYGISSTVYGVADPIAVLETISVGSSVSMRLRGGDYPSAAQFSELTGAGYADTPAATETRVYAWTWVNKESGYEFESAPSPASTSVNVYPTQAVSISGRASVPTGYIVTHWRLYRSVSGVYLFVGELPVSQISFTDEVLAESLGEELPSLTWEQPPATLQGLTNLPNGVMAGFVGRDVYFCDPYHPHAWPPNYTQSLDYPVVGLGRMDTTLAVLTTGTPYFLQGSHPDSIVVVKSDLEQACASKRSIVSTNGVVMYASPDGLVLLSPGGSKLVTEQYFTRAQWQTYFKPDSIHGYSHDLKYIGFYNNGTTTGGFIYDPTSGQFILHDIYVTAAYADLQRDKLFIALADRSVKVWLAGANKTYTWKSKKFTLPQVTGFSCAQLEAETYPVTAKFYSGGTLIRTQTVANRNPFRLPVAPGRDWEVQIEGTSEVFSLAIAQSIEELAGV